MEFTEANNRQMQERVKDKINRIASMASMEYVFNIYLLI